MVRALTIDLLAALVVMAGGSGGSDRDLWWTAIERGDVPAVRALLDAEPGLLEERDAQYSTALGVAAREGHKGLVEFLLKVGAAVDAPAGARTTPLYHAVRSGHREIVGLLLGAGAKPDVSDQWGWTAVSIALYNDDLDIAEVLLSQGATMDVMVASALGKTDLVRAFVQKDATLAKGAPGGLDEVTPLHWAARMGQIPVIELLLASGATIEAGAASGGTPLAWAASKGQVGTVALLLERGAQAGSSGRVNGPLHAAALSGRAEIIRLLVQKGASVRAANHWGETPLHWCAGAGNVEGSKLLLANGADPNAEAAFWCSGELLHVWAAQLGAAHPEMTLYGPRFILTMAGSGMRVDDLPQPQEWVHAEAPTEEDERKVLGFISGAVSSFTPLHWAAYTGQADVGSLLINSAADVNHGGPLGCPLHWACRCGSKELAEALLARGADANWLSVLGPPLLWAARTGQRDVGQLLLAKGADLQGMDGHGRTALHLAAFYGEEEFADLLLAKGARLDAKDKSGRTPLALAVKQGHSGMADLLRRHGATQ
jgi:ankyrin repeat protein